jgi:hypothetical protein
MEFRLCDFVVEPAAFDIAGSVQPLVVIELKKCVILQQRMI